MINGHKKQGPRYSGATVHRVRWPAQWYTGTRCTPAGTTVQQDNAAAELQYAGTAGHRYSGTSVNWYTVTRLRRYTGTAVVQYAGTAVHWYTGTPVPWYGYLDIRAVVH